MAVLALKLSFLGGGHILKTTLIFMFNLSPWPKQCESASYNSFSQNWISLYYNTFSNLLKWLCGNWSLWHYTSAFHSWIQSRAGFSTNCGHLHSPRIRVVIWSLFNDCDENQQVPCVLQNQLRRRIELIAEYGKSRLLLQWLICCYISSQAALCGLFDFTGLNW